jgi:hypothetical protein
MLRAITKMRWPALVVGLSLLAGALPATSALATQPRITVARAVAVPAQDTIVHKTITTSFDVTLAPRDASGLSLVHCKSVEYRVA